MVLLTSPIHQTNHAIIGPQMEIHLPIYSRERNSKSCQENLFKIKVLLAIHGRCLFRLSVMSYVTILIIHPMM